jgi:hypothetical protein
MTGIASRVQATRMPAYDGALPLLPHRTNGTPQSAVDSPTYAGNSRPPSPRINENKNI